jgi:hypothetical protein
LAKIKLKRAAPFLLAIILILTSIVLINYTGWFKTNKEKIKGVWETKGSIMFSCPYASKLNPKNPYLDSIYKNFQTVELTFHGNGQVTSSGETCGWYSFTGKRTIKYQSKGHNLDQKFYTIDFPTKNEMIWYIDSRKWGSFNRVRK